MFPIDPDADVACDVTPAIEVTWAVLTPEP